MCVAALLQLHPSSGNLRKRKMSKSKSRQETGDGKRGPRLRSPTSHGTLRYPSVACGDRVCTRTTNPRFWCSSRFKLDRLKTLKLLHDTTGATRLSAASGVLAWAPALITGPCCSGSAQFGVKQVPVEFVLIERKDLKIDAFVLLFFFICWRIFRDILHHLDIWHK